MADEKVLTVIEDGVLIHIGAPQTFNSDLLVEYAKRGCKIETFTIDEFRLSGWKLYEKVPESPSPDGWVRVEDGLPDIDQYVICITNEKGFSPTDIIISKYSRYGFESASNVTHWRPLPPAPETKGGEG